jgi:hypothetical protein
VKSSIVRYVSEGFRYAAINRIVLVGCSLPGPGLDSLLPSVPEFPGQVWIIQNATNPIGNGLHIVWVYEYTGVADDFWQGGCARGYHRHAAAHCLRYWNTESFVQSRKRKHRRMAVELPERQAGARPKQMNAIRESLGGNLNKGPRRILIPCTSRVGPDKQQIKIAYEIVSQSRVCLNEA